MPSGRPKRAGSLALIEFDSRSEALPGFALLLREKSLKLVEHVLDRRDSWSPSQAADPQVSIPRCVAA